MAKAEGRALPTSARNASAPSVPEVSDLLHCRPPRHVPSRRGVVPSARYALSLRAATRPEAARSGWARASNSRRNGLQRPRAQRSGAFKRAGVSRSRQGQLRLRLAVGGWRRLGFPRTSDLLQESLELGATGPCVRPTSPPAPPLSIPAPPGDRAAHATRSINGTLSGGAALSARSTR